MSICVHFGVPVIGQGWWETPFVAGNYQWAIILKNADSCWCEIQGSAKLRLFIQTCTMEIYTAEYCLSLTRMYCWDNIRWGHNTNKLIFDILHLLCSHRPAYATRAAEDGAQILKRSNLWPLLSWPLPQSHSPTRWYFYLHFLMWIWKFCRRLNQILEKDCREYSVFVFCETFHKKQQRINVSHQQKL